jgi:hypothetical protein
MVMVLSIRFQQFLVVKLDQLLMNFHEVISTNKSLSLKIFINYYFRYFMNLVQQSGDLELITLLQGNANQNIYNSQNVLNITVLIPQQMSIQQMGNAQELSMVNKRRS